MTPGLLRGKRYSEASIPGCLNLADVALRLGHGTQRFRGNSFSCRGIWGDMTEVVSKCDVVEQTTLAVALVRRVFVGRMS